MGLLLFVAFVIGLVVAPFLTLGICFLVVLYKIASWIPWWGWLAIALILYFAWKSSA